MPSAATVVAGFGVGAAAVQAWRWRRAQRARHLRNDDIRHAIEDDAASSDTSASSRYAAMNMWSMNVC